MAKSHPKEIHVAVKNGRRYPQEFRDDAVRLCTASFGKSLATVSRDLGIATESLRHWCKQVDLDSGKRKDGLTSEERDELRRLRRENRILVEEREILKKAGGLLRSGERGRTR